MSIYDKSSLVLIPSGTKTGKVFSQKPVSGDGDFTFTRASAATRVNADGLIEKETGNLLTYSNTFDNAAWGNSGAFVTGGESGYDGTNNAWRLGAVNSSPYISQGNFSTLRTHSLYVKAGTYDQVSIIIGGYGQGVQFDLTSGTIVVNSNPSIYYPTITSVVSGWYRISVFVAPSAPTYGFLIAAQILYSGGISVGEYIYIQAAQTEQSLVARDYQETTTAAVYGGITDNTPRLDYTDSSCPALLLEPLRTNLVSHSEYFGAWNKSTNAITITSNYGLSPEGLQNSSRVQFTAASQHINISTSLGTGVTSTGSVYIKGTAGETIEFDTGGVGALRTLTGDWQRIEVTSTSASSLLLINTFGGATARDIEIWGAQMEQASYATSYIPTYGSSVTRVFDDCEITSASDLFGTSQGSIYVEGNLILDTNGSMPFTAGNGTSNLIYAWMRADGQVVIDFFQGGSQQAVIISSGGFISNGDSFKLSIGYQNNDFVAYVNGTQLSTTIVGGVAPNPNDLRLGGYIAPDYYGSGIKQALLFKTRLSNEELAALTTI